MEALTEAALSHLETSIPELARGAIQQAYFQALTRHGMVIEAVGGHLLKVKLDGTHTVIGNIAPPTPVTLGLKRFRSRPAR